MMDWLAAAFDQHGDTLRILGLWLGAAVVVAPLAAAVLVWTVLGKLDEDDGDGAASLGERDDG